MSESVRLRWLLPLHANNFKMVSATYGTKEHSVDVAQSLLANIGDRVHERLGLVRLDEIRVKKEVRRADGVRVKSKRHSRLHVWECRKRRQNFERGDDRL